MFTYEFLQNYWWAIISLLGGLLVFLMFVQGGNSLIFITKDEEERQLIVSINSRQAVIFITLIYMIAITLEFIDKLLIAKAHDLFEIAAVIKRLSAIFEVFLPANTALGHKLAEVCLRIFGILKIGRASCRERV